MSGKGGGGKPSSGLWPFVLVSVSLHLALFLVPTAWWQATWPGPEGDRVGVAGRILAVSVMDLPGEGRETVRVGERAVAAKEQPPTPSGKALAAADKATTPLRKTSAPESKAAPESGRLPREKSAFFPPKPEPPGEPRGDLEPGTTAVRGEEGEGQAGNGKKRGGSGIVAPRYLPPRLLTGALPLSPQESKGLKLPPEIAVRMLIGRDGRVRRVEPADPHLPAVLVEAMERSARAMRFAPATLGGKPVEAWFSMSFAYRQ